jgi:hypothetical protein
MAVTLKWAKNQSFLPQEFKNWDISKNSSMFCSVEDHFSKSSAMAGFDYFFETFEKKKMVAKN